MFFNGITLICFQARNLLERHLVIADRAFTMADLKNKNETIILPTQRDSLKIRVKEEDQGKLVYFNLIYVLFLSILCCSQFSFQQFSIIMINNKAKKKSLSLSLSF